MSKKRKHAKCPHDFFPPSELTEPEVNLLLWVLADLQRQVDELLAIPDPDKAPTAH